MRSTKTAVIWSLVLPGAGQVYNKQWPKALIYGGIAILPSLFCLGTAVPAMINALMSLMDQISLDPGADVTPAVEHLVHSLGPAGFWLVVTTLAYIAAAIDAGVTAARQSRQPQQSIVGGPIA